MTLRLNKNDFSTMLLAGAIVTASVVLKNGYRQSWHQRERPQT